MVNKIAAPIDIIDSHSASPLRGTVVHSCRCWRVVNALGGITLGKTNTNALKEKTFVGKIISETWHQKS